MNHPNELKKQYALKNITEDEYIRILMNLYFREYITLEELKARIK